MAGFLLWSCHAPVIRARCWIMAITFFFSALFGRPLAATIDLRVELMTKMTNPRGARVREIMREMERDRERGEQETKTNLHNTGTQSHTVLYVWLSSVYFGWSVCGEERWHIYAAQGRHFLLGSWGSWWDAGMMRLALTGAATPTARLGHRPDKSCLLEPQKTQDRAGSVIPTWQWPQHQSLELI